MRLPTAPNWFCDSGKENEKRQDLKSVGKRRAAPRHKKASWDSGGKGEKKLNGGGGKTRKKKDKVRRVGEEKKPAASKPER